MPFRHRVLWALVIVVCVLLLMAPALWNDFPLLQWDTGGYLARWYEGTLVPSRAVIYGLILTAGVPFAFWPVLVLQAALTVWIVALMLRAHGLGKRPRLLAITITALAVTTTLPWLTAILLTDIFCGLGVLALYLLLMRGERVRRGERIGLIVLIAAAAATHSATFALLAGLLVCGALVALIARKRVPARRLGHGVIALALGAVLVFAADYAVAGRLAWTPGGFALSFGRMLQDGIVKKYLDEHCPDAKLRLCAVKDRIPQDADTWFWGSDLFDQMGRFAGLGQEMETIALESLIDYPSLQFESAVSDTAHQLVAVRTGEGIQDDLWHTRTIIERYTPQLAPAMRASREQQGEISLGWHQSPAIPGGAGSDGTAAAARVARLARHDCRRDRRARRGRRAHAAWQRLHLRRAVEPARPLRRARGVARGARRLARACTCHGSASPPARQRQAVTPELVRRFSSGSSYPRWQLSKTLNIFREATLGQ